MKENDILRYRNCKIKIKLQLSIYINVYSFDKNK